MAHYAFLIFVVVYTITQGHCSILASHNQTVEEFCLNETDVTKETVNSYTENPEKEPTEDFFCYLHCVLSTLGFIDDNGTVLVDQFKLNFPEVDEECLKKSPKIIECTDMEALRSCNI